MAFPINPWDSQQLINATQVNSPLIHTVADLVNALYVLIGGIVGISIIFLLFRTRQSWVTRRKMQQQKENMDILVTKVNSIDKKLDKILKKKK